MRTAGEGGEWDRSAADRCSGADSRCSRLPLFARCALSVQTQLEHILLRPDTYIGSVESEVEPYWVAAPEVSARTEGRGPMRSAAP